MLIWANRSNLTQVTGVRVDKISGSGQQAARQIGWDPDDTETFIRWIESIPYVTLVLPAFECDCFFLVSILETKACNIWTQKDKFQDEGQYANDVKR